MAVELSIVTKGAENLASLQTLMDRHPRLLKAIEIGNNTLSASFEGSRKTVAKYRAEWELMEKSTESATKATQRHGISITDMASAYLKFKVISAVWNTVEHSIQAATQAVIEYDAAAARTTRIIGPQYRGEVQSQLRYGVASSGREIQEAGEAYYQLATFISDATTRAKAFDNVMETLAGTQGDAREISRATIQIYEQFGNEFAKTTTEAEKFNTITELIATSFKSAHLEANEFAQAMKYLGPIAAATGTPLAQTVALVNTLATIGQRGRMGGTGLAQLIGHLATNYSETEHGAVRGKDVAHYELLTTPSGGFDVLSTLQQLKRLHQDVFERHGKVAADEYAKAVAGSINSWRALMAIIAPSSKGFELLTKNMKEASDAMNGLTNNRMKLAQEELNTFASQFGLAWKGIIADLSSGFNDLANAAGLKGMLHDVAEFFKERAKLNAIERTHDTERALKTGESARYRDLELLNRLENFGPRQSQRGPGRFGQIQSRPNTIYPNDSGLFTSGEMESMHKWWPDLDFGQGIPTELFEAQREKIYSLSYGALQGGARGLTRVKDMPKAGQPGYTGDPIGKKHKDDSEKQRRLAIQHLHDLRDLYSAQMTELEEHVSSYDPKVFGDLVKKFKDVEERLAVLDHVKHGESYKWMVKHGRTPADIRGEKARDAYADFLSHKYIGGLELDASEIADPFSASGMRVAANLDDAEARFAMRDTASHDPDVIAARRARERGERYRRLMAQKQYWIQSYGTSQAERYRHMGVGIELAQPFEGMYTDDLFAQAGRIRAETGMAQSQYGQQAKYTSALMMFGGERGQIDEAKNKLSELADKILLLGRSAEETNARIKERMFRWGVEDIGIAGNQARFKLGLGGGRRFGETDEQFNRRRQSLQLGYAETYATDLAALDTKYEGQNVSEAERRSYTSQRLDLLNNLRKSMDDLNQSIIDEKNAKRDAIYQQFRGQVEGGILDFYHNPSVGSLSKSVSGIGNTIIENAILGWIKPFVDPMVTSLTDNTYNLRYNRDALVNLTSAIQTGVAGGIAGSFPGSGGAGCAAAGLFGGIVGAATANYAGTKKPSSTDASVKAGLTDIQMGMAAYSIFQNGQQQGPFQGAVSGAMAGAAIGSAVPGIGTAIGAGVGGAIGLIGGLFGHKKKEDTTQRDTNPAFFNAPSTMEYWAYRMRATGGKLPSDLQMLDKYKNPSQTAPVILIIDGVRHVVNKAMTEQTALGRVSLGSSSFDALSPV